MAEAIIYNEKRVMPVCDLLKGEFGIDGYYVGVPAVLGENGVEKIIEFDLNTDERALLDNAAKAVK